MNAYKCSIYKFNGQKGKVMISVFNSVIITGSNESKVLAILEVLRIYFGAFHESLIIIILFYF